MIFAQIKQNIILIVIFNKKIPCSCDSHKQGIFIKIKNYSAL